MEVPGYESGNFVGPTLIAGVTTEMDCWKSEIFGPVLVCLEVRAQIERNTVLSTTPFSNVIPALSFLSGSKAVLLVVK